MSSTLTAAQQAAAAQAAAEASANAFYREDWTLLGIGLSFIILRCYARWSMGGGFSGLKADDYLMVAAGAIYSMESTAAYCVGFLAHGLANNGMTDAEREALVVGSPEWNTRQTGIKIQLIGWSLYTLLLWTLKLCMVIFYSRITAGLDNQVLKIRIGVVAIVCTYIATILSIHLGCLPYHKNFQINPDPGNHCQPAISKIDCYVTVVLNVATDLYLMTIPLPLLWRAQIPLKRKLLLLAMFSGGCFVIMAGILRVALILADPENGAQAAGSWACRETFVAVIIGNVPMIYPLFMRGVTAAKSTIYGNGTLKTWGSSKGSKGGTNMELPRYNNLESKKGRGARDPHTIGMTIMGASESEERIIRGEAIKSEVSYEVKSAPASLNEEADNYQSSRKTGYTVSVAGPHQHQV